MNYKFIFLLLSFFIFLDCYAKNLVLVKLNNPLEINYYLQQNQLVVNYYNNNFFIGTTDNLNVCNGCQLIDDNAWSYDCNYYLMWIEENMDIHSLTDYHCNGDIIFTCDNFCIVRTNHNAILNYDKQSYRCVVAIENRSAKTVVDKLNNDKLQNIYEDSLLIFQLVSNVDRDSLLYYDKHLQDYGTRKCNLESTIVVQNWIKDHFERLGYTTELQDVYNFPTKNVIAVKRGTKYPDEYVICGSHYDSYSYSGNAPGADDNASGTAGMLEIARVLSNYQFERSIVICTFTAEELGLYGSNAYASRCANENMDIVGYFNIDMSGYLAKDSTIHAYVIFPESSRKLFDYYVSTCSTYVPDLIVSEGHLSGGDSDHTSFNENGFMGIFPFENPQKYSPYIHTQGDTIGLSVNNFEQMKMFTQGCLSNVVRLASTGGNEGILDNSIGVSLFPNPANNIITLQNSNMDTVNVIIYDESGNVITKINNVDHQTDINISKYKSGIYFLYVMFENGSHKMMKFVKK